MPITIGAANANAVSAAMPRIRVSGPGRSRGSALALAGRAAGKTLESATVAPGPEQGGHGTEPERLREPLAGRAAVPRGHDLAPAALAGDAPVDLVVARGDRLLANGAGSSGRLACLLRTLELETAAFAHRWPPELRGSGGGRGTNLLEVG